MWYWQPGSIFFNLINMAKLNVNFRLQQSFQLSLLPDWCCKPKVLTPYRITYILRRPLQEFDETSKSYLKLLCSVKKSLQISSYFSWPSQNKWTLTFAIRPRPNKNYTLPGLLKPRNLSFYGMYYDLDVKGWVRD